MPEWTIEYFDSGFERFYLALSPYKQAVVEAALTTVLAVPGIGKGRDPSARRQQKEIARARAMLQKCRGSR